VRENLEYYKSAGYAGVFLTDHFIDGNVNRELRHLTYEEKINAYFQVYEDAVAIAEEIGIDVFSGIEMGAMGPDFLVYGIGREWCLAHPDMDKMKKSELLGLLMVDGALVIQAHPFREAKYIDHVELFPRCIHGVEIFNAGMGEFQNAMATQFCQSYGLIPFAGSDNHTAGRRTIFGGMATERPIESVEDFISMVKNGEAKPFIKDESGIRFI
jgi:hypothetical protein